VLALTGARLFTGEAMLDGHAVLIAGGRIAALVPAAAVPADARRCALDGGLLAPGFIDIQVNGGGGVLFNDRPDADAVFAIGAAHRRFGTTGLLPTLITDRPEATPAAVAAVRRAIAEPVPGGARVLGIHLEGPFLNPARRGVHDAAAIRAPTSDDIAGLAALGADPQGGRVLLTVAPEVLPAGAIRKLKAAGVIVAAGHTEASYEQVRAALAEGLAGFTHLFNAMTPLASRAPGAVGAALDDAASWCGLIADGHHVHPASLRVAIAAKPRGRMLLVTDAMPPVGTDMTDFLLYERVISVADGRCLTADGTLAGSVLDMATAVRNAVHLLGLPLAEALRMASAYPAAALGLDHELGRIAPGHRADLVLLDDALHVRGTWVGGHDSRGV
jgi:N-acetylglucosamine-6-phosphate deacetylase